MSGKNGEKVVQRPDKGFRNRGRTSTASQLRDDEDAEEMRAAKGHRQQSLMVNDNDELVQTPPYGWDFVGDKH